MPAEDGEVEGLVCAGCGVFGGVGDGVVGVGGGGAGMREGVGAAVEGFFGCHWWW